MSLVRINPVSGRAMRRAPYLWIAFRMAGSKEWVALVTHERRTVMRVGGFAKREHAVREMEKFRQRRGIAPVDWRED